MSQMVNSLFQIIEGLNIDGAINIIHGSGAPIQTATVGSQHYQLEQQTLP